ncbi:periplasmic heavy metal sensor [uncultured Roseobacter sp.]|uniref:periplasmic heavy metal sensor n=1 Tax=uncultured Roseobacter sp. TaxID=114847 RepID=UPI00260B6FDA|nr:periplasmic heavy metal sensor [uncultured Roseobacter sp.]
MARSSDGRGGMPRWVKLLLGVSLALNLAVAGIVAGAMLRDGGDRRGGPRLGAFGGYAAPYIMALPPETRRAVLQTMRGRGAAGDGAMPDRTARRAFYADVITALEAQPFDRAALTAALARQARGAVAVQQVGQAAWLEVVTDMNDADRAEYALAVEEVLARGAKRHR